MKNLRDKLEKIVKVLNCCEDKKCETCQMYTDKLLSLFKQQMKEIIGGMEEIELEKTDKEMNLEKEVGHKIDYSNQKEFIRNKLRKELLKNMEEVK